MVSVRRHRFDRARALRQLDPVADRTQIVRALFEFEFPWDFMRSLELALFRTYAVPSIGRLLDRTGELRECTQRRYDDTTLILYHLWTLGPDAGDGERAARQLNLVHAPYPISNDDFRYTLATFVVTPIRWLREFGWRRLTPAEVAAWTNVMRDMGDSMGIDDIPATYAQFETLLDDYEAANFGYDPANERTAAATFALMASWYPRPARPAVIWSARQLLEPHVHAAVGTAPGTARGRALVRAALRTRAALLRHLARPRRAAFAPPPRSYPDGYRIDELGPERVVRGGSHRPGPDDEIAGSAAVRGG